MKRLLLVWLTVLSLTAGAQTYNNEWIDYSRTYYKFKVGSTGLHRLPQPLLAQMNLGSTNAEHFQLWRNGKQIPLFTSVQNGVLGTADYIEFWGEMNDGKADNPLYRESDYQISDHWSLQTDTASYFLTVNAASSNFRLIPTSNNVATNTLPAEPYFMHTEGRYPRVQINPGRAEQVLTSTVYSSSYDYGEGWTGGNIGYNGTETNSLTNLSVYSGSGAPSATLRINMCGNIMNERRYRIRLNGDSILGASLDYYEYTKTGKIFPVSSIAGNTANIEISNLSQISNDRMVVAQLELTYPRKFEFGGSSNFTFSLPANVAGNYLEITGFSYSGPAPVLYDLTNGRRYEMNTATAGVLKVVLQPSPSDRSLVLVSQASGNIKAITAFEQRNFIDYSLPANQGDFLIITNAALTAASGTGDPVEDYRQYRSSAEGGAYNAKIYLIDQLIDQYAFGIKMHPLSIRNFVRRARERNTVVPRNVFLIGKGVIYSSYRSNESNANISRLQFVPTFGNPASDNLLTAQANSSIPLVPIGRLSVINKAEITAYLNKVKSYEIQLKTTPPEIALSGWKKNIIHVTGASDKETSDLLVSALNGHKRIIEDTFYGGNVSTFSKTSAEAVQQVSATQIGNLFKAGVGILTYFGHSSATTLEFNLDNPNAYDNAGKYPVFIVMGCNAGNFYLYNEGRLVVKETISENYILTPDKGAVAFLASTHLGVVHYLDIYNTRFYRAMSTNKYGAPIGQIMDEAIAQMLNVTGGEDFYARFQCEQFTLHGDPAVRMYAFDKPDYVIEDPMVVTNPSFISLAEASFQVKAKFMNLGKAIKKNFVVEMRRTYPNQSVEVLRRDTIPSTKYADSLIYTIPINALRDKGLNKISVTIDVDNDIDELHETNNSVTKEVYIYEDELRPAFPYNFSIISNATQTLTASTANSFAEKRDYIMEMDTTELFNSSFKIVRNTNSAGGIVEFNPGVTLKDSTVYYWRVSPNVPNVAPVWNTSSFTYIQGSQPGFGQSHLYQQFKSEYSGLKLDSVSRKLSFDSTTHDIFIRSGVFPTSFAEEQGYTVIVDGDDRIRSTCGISNINVNVFDPITLEPWFNNESGQPGQYGSDAVCGTGRRWNFQFNILNQANRLKMVEFLNMIPDGYMVVIRNTSGTAANSNTYANDWKNDAAFMGAGNTIYDRLKEQGFETIDSFNRPRAFIFVYQKNTAQFQPRYKFSDGIYDPITLGVDIFTQDSVGYIKSPLFGPALAWHTLNWKGSSLDNTAGDLATVDIIGVNSAGVETVVQSNITPANSTVDISGISAAQYPNIRLRMSNMDSVHLTPYQLRYWMLTYQPVPEGAIAPNLYFNMKDTVDIGEPLNFGIAFKNISAANFDSVKVKLTVTDRNNVETIIPLPRQRKLQTTSPNDTLHLNAAINTAAFAGSNFLFVNFNPDNDQPEQSTFNNYAFRNFYVRPDTLNPLMDVTFDGTHILNRDIVAAKPAILIKLKDESKWMSLNDTAAMTLQVRYPDGTLRSYHFSNNQDTVQWIPAGQAPNADNEASINFKPHFSQDGEYELIVSGRDRSNNAAGIAQYRVNFQVINKPMISNMLNYPNPFTTSTAFVFTLTGSEVPQNIRIQILTITGKVVRDITKDELGPIRIGRNITEFKWDGTDQYGQKLANGVYLYRVITNLNGKSLDKYKSTQSGNADNTDKFFNNGYGKMYLMR
jgi:hypothetical protein